MLAFASILGIIPPYDEVIRLVTLGPWSAVTQFMCITVSNKITACW